MQYIFVSALYQKVFLFSFARYTRDNVLASERVGRSYIEAIPGFLKNRPASFIKHCMGKIDLAETVKQRDITQVSDNCYKVNKCIMVLICLNYLLIIDLRLILIYMYFGSWYIK